MAEFMDANLVRETLEGSLGAYDQLMLRYQKLVYKIALGFAGERDQALDLSQTVFLKAFERLDSLAEPGQFKAWLIRITYNECIGWQRSRRFYEPFDADLAADEAEADQDAGLLEIENRKKLGQMLGRLNPKHRLALVLKYLEGLSIREIAAILQCSEGVVKNMLYRSMQRLAYLSKARSS